MSLVKAIQELKQLDSHSETNLFPKELQNLFESDDEEEEEKEFGLDQISPSILEILSTKLSLKKLTNK
jgi:hypothetical protein